jgi:hypothetical protein
MGEYYNKVKKKEHSRPIMVFWAHGLMDFVPSPPKIGGLCVKSIKP